MTAPTSQRPVRRALLSVSDKDGIVEFGRALASLGIELLSTGGTASALAQAGVPVTEVAEYTAFPEMLDGRVKTLHPKVHAGLLARRDAPAHLAALEQHGIGTIDLLAVNLYPFQQTVARADCSLEDAIENIDIGGPAMLRAAAKNHDAVTVLVDPDDYEQVLGQLTRQGGVDQELRFALAVKAYAHTARYDGAVANYLSAISGDGSRAAYPDVLSLQLNKVQTLRYGENPHQQAAFYRDIDPPAGALANYRQLQGKELSYNNIADADAAWECVKSFDAPACVIVKHANPCGAAVGEDPATCYERAFATDPTSAFGGIIAFNRPLDEATVAAVSRQFVEVLIAPAFSDEALALMRSRQNVRILQIALASGSNTMDVKRVGGGLLVQTPDERVLEPAELRVVTRKRPDDAQMADLRFAWQVARFVKSNAIVFCGGGRTLGVGAGQMSRIDSGRIAAIKAENAGLSLQGCVVASDAFFPFRDGLDSVADAGAAAVIQPGGSMRDQEVIDAADERGVAMVFTGVPALPALTDRMRILGIDPGLRLTGFGLIDADRQKATYLASGVIRSGVGTLPARIQKIHQGIVELVEEYRPDIAVCEIVFVNVNPRSTLLLGQARGAAIGALVSRSVDVHEYTALQVKQAVVGYGRANKSQVQMMVQRLLLLPGTPSPDAADALACAVCHVHAGAMIHALGTSMRRGRIVG